MTRTRLLHFPCSPLVCHRLLDSAEVNPDWVDVQPFNRDEINRVMENYKRTKAIFAGTFIPLTLLYSSLLTSPL